MSVGTSTAAMVDRRRTAARLTQETLAQIIGVDTMTVSRWERGVTADIELRHNEPLAEALKISLDELDRREASYRTSPAATETEQPSRLLDAEAVPATDVRLATVSPKQASLPAERAAGLGVELWEFHEVLRYQRVGREVLELAERASAHLDARFTELPPTVLFREVGRQFGHVVGWLREPQPVRYRQRLCSLAGWHRVSLCAGWVDVRVVG